MKLLDQLIELENQANQFGFSWENAGQIVTQIESECEEIKIHLEDNNKKLLQEEIGDLMHAVFSLCVFCKLNPQQTLSNSISKFERRFNSVKQLAKAHGLYTLRGLTFEELMKFWESAKAMEKNEYQSID